MNGSSVKMRFLVSLGANVGRAGISFFTGVLVARGLSPIGYGDLFFLLGSFTAIRALMDLGTSSAFYTFIAQRSRERAFYVFYFAWLGLQFLVTVLVILVVLPDAVINRVWLGHSQDVILLVFVASFMQQKVWATIIQVCEAVRKTVLVQMTGLFVVAVHLGVILFLMWMEWLSIEAVLLAILSEYLIAGTVIWRILEHQSTQKTKLENEGEFSFKGAVAEYWVFCKPLIVIAIVSFGYEFVDRWLLQRFGGSEQQGFYQISAQFAAVSLLATASVLSIFWKEIAEAYKQQNHDRVEVLYHKTSRSLLMLGAVIACFLVPWAEQLTLLLLGAAYAAAWPILAVMFLYPVHQSMGQINATMFMACDRTRPYMYLTLIGMLISMPLTYFLLVPSGEWLVPGLGLGAMGLALKMVGLNILLVNIQGWLLARYHKWKYKWAYQIEGLVFLLCLGFGVKVVVIFLAGGAILYDMSPFLLISMLLGAGILYLSGVFSFLWFRPSLFGLERCDVKKVFSWILNKFGTVHAG